MEIILRHTHTARHQNLSHPVAAERALQTERGKLNAARPNAATPERSRSSTELQIRRGNADSRTADDWYGLDDLVVLAGSLHPIPSRTRP
jgi:hypothetical protein